MPQDERKPIIQLSTNPPLKSITFMRMIPLELLAEIIHDDFYQKCCLCNATEHINFHHHVIFGGRQLNEKFAIVPLCKSCHDTEKKRDINDKISWIVLNRASDEELKEYSKVENLINKRARLNEKFGKYERNMS